MSVTKWEFEQCIVNRIRGVFEAMDKQGRTAGDLFDAAKLAVTERMKHELQSAHEIEFDRFNDQYMHGIERDTEF